MTDKKKPTLTDVKALSPAEQVTLSCINAVAKRVQVMAEAAIKKDDLEQMAPGYAMSLAIRIAFAAADQALTAMKLETNPCQRMDGVAAGMDTVINGGKDGSPDVKGEAMGHLGQHVFMFAHEKYGYLPKIPKAAALASLGLPPGAQVQLMELASENMETLTKSGAVEPSEDQKYHEAKGKQSKDEVHKAKPKDASHLTAIDGGKIDPKKLN